MDHQTFVRRIESATKSSQNDGVITELRQLLDDLNLAIKTGVNDWHQQQVLGLLVDKLDAAGREEECRAAWLALVELIEQTSTYWQEALATARTDAERWELAHPHADRTD